MRYTGLAADQGYGSYPDGEMMGRRPLYFTTPGAGNDPSFPPAPLFINEWMASNTGSVLDPADFDADDWFEIYNAGDETVDLTGYRLTDNAVNPAKFVIPAGYEIPARGFFLVWADEEQGQSSLTGELHVNFRLGASGETIQISDPNGRLIDSVTFGAQSANISQGRFPDGDLGPLVAMPIWTPGAPNQLTPAAAPELQNPQVDLTGGTVTLTWNAEPGKVYRVQYKHNLADAEWQDVPGGDVVGGLKVDASVAGIGQRFYRVLMLP
jgi:hypothetical protein